MTLRAKELRIVFEDDDGRAYTQTFAPPNAAVLNAVAAVMRMGSEEPPIVGPVLRKVTTVRGRADRNGIDIIHLPHLLPEEIRAQDFGAVDDLRGPPCVFRFDVIAVRVLSPENKDGAG